MLSWLWPADGLQQGWRYQRLYVLRIPAYCYYDAQRKTSCSDYINKFNFHFISKICRYGSQGDIVFKWPIIHTVYQWPFPEYFCLVLTDTRPLPELNWNNIRPSTNSTEKNWVGCVSLSVAYNRRPSSDRAWKVTPTTKLKKSIKSLQVMPCKLNLKKEFSQASYWLMQNNNQRSVAG